MRGEYLLSFFLLIGVCQAGLVYRYYRDLQENSAPISLINAEPIISELRKDQIPVTVVEFQEPEIEIKPVQSARREESVQPAVPEPELKLQPQPQPQLQPQPEPEFQLQKQEQKLLEPKPEFQPQPKPLPQQLAQLEQQEPQLRSNDEAILQQTQTQTQAQTDFVKAAPSASENLPLNTELPSAPLLEAQRRIDDQILEEEVKEQPSIKKDALREVVSVINSEIASEFVQAKPEKLPKQEAKKLVEDVQSVVAEVPSIPKVVVSAVVPVVPVVDAVVPVAAEHVARDISVDVVAPVVDAEPVVVVQSVDPVAPVAIVDPVAPVAIIDPVVRSIPIDQPAARIISEDSAGPAEFVAVEPIAVGATDPAAPVAAVEPALPLVAADPSLRVIAIESAAPAEPLVVAVQPVQEEAPAQQPKEEFQQLKSLPAEKPEAEQQEKLQQNEQVLLKESAPAKEPTPSERQATEPTPTQTSTQQNFVQQLIQNSPIGQFFNQLSGQQQQASTEQAATTSPTTPVFLNPAAAITSAQQAVQSAAQSVVNSTTQAFQGLQQFASNLGNQFQSTLSNLGGQNQNQLSGSAETTTRAPGPLQSFVNTFVAGNQASSSTSAPAGQPQRPLQGIINFFQGGNRPNPANSTPKPEPIKEESTTVGVDDKLSTIADEVLEAEATNEVRTSAEKLDDSIEDGKPEELIIVNDDDSPQPQKQQPQEVVV